MDFLIPEEKPKAPDFQFATVATVESNGVTLLFDGESEAGSKVYKTAAGVVLHVGDRVKVCRDSGTVVVEYAIGTPGSSPADVHGIPSGGTAGQVLTKSSGTDYAAEWRDVPKELPSASADDDGKALTLSGGAPTWAYPFGIMLQISGGRLMFKTADSLVWTTLANIGDVNG